MTISGHSHQLSNWVLVLAFLIVGVLLGCRRVSVNGHAPMSLTLTSASFRQGETIPQQFTCDGADFSPALSWSTPPSNTKSFALLVTDPDSLFGAYVHWILYNLPPGSNRIGEGVPRTEVLPDGAKQGVNSGNEAGYSGPCPPGETAHRYVFTLYALDTSLSPPPPADKSALLKSMEGHVLASGQLIGRYHR
jgi:Raf kinase inhibitor-like YbhB/YbcL family protein